MIPRISVSALVRGSNNMKRILTLLLTAIILAQPAMAADTAAPAAGTQFPSAIVAVVDMQKILQDSTAAKGVRDQLAGRRASYQQQVTADSQKLREAEKELIAQRGKISDEEFAKKRGEFEKKVSDAQKAIQERTRILDTAFNEALNTIRGSIGQIVADAAKARGVTLVLDKSQVVVVESSLDITSVVLADLNKKLPKVDVKLPASESQAKR